MKKKSRCEDEFSERNRILSDVNGSDRRVSFLRHSSKSFISHSLINTAAAHFDSFLPLNAGLSKANSCFAFSGSSSDTNLGSETRGSGEST